MQQVIGLQPDFNVLQQVFGAFSGGGDQTDKLRRSDQGRPQTGHLHQRSFTACPGHRQGKQTALTDCYLDLFNDLPMVRRPGQIEHIREIHLTEGFETGRGSGLALRIDDRGDLSDVLAGPGQVGIPPPSGLSHLVIGAFFLGRLQVALSQPGGIAEQVHRLGVPDGISSAVAMAAEGALVEHLAESGGIENPRQFGGLQLRWINRRHRPPPVPGMRYIRSG